MSKLIPDELLVSIPELYETEGFLNPTCHVKLFTPDSNWTWYIIQYSADTGTCYGYVEGIESELGYFQLSELSSVRGQLGLAIELDSTYTPTLLSNVKKNEHVSS